MTPRLAFATAPPAVVADHDTDRALHDSACAAAGFELEHRIWSDPDVDWDGYDLVVVRSTWDYLDHLAAYRAWLDRMGRLATFHNPAPVVAWSLDKRYLLDLSDAGVPVVPMRVCEDLEQVGSAIGSLGSGGEVVVKPVTSAGSRNTGRFHTSDPAALALASDILDSRAPVLVQPAVASVARRGEVSTLLFGGRVSHAVRKGPILELGGGLVGGRYEERLQSEELTQERRAVVMATSGALGRLVSGRFGVTDPLLYARVDLVQLDDGSEAVLEVELAEPAFFLDVEPAAAHRFAAELARRVGGVGPPAHGDPGVG